MEVILSAAFGLKTDSQTNPDDKISTLAKRAMKPPPWATLALMVPFIGRQLSRKVASSRFGFGWYPITEMATDVINERKTTTSNSQRKVGRAFVLHAELRNTYCKYVPVIIMMIGFR